MGLKTFFSNQRNIKISIFVVTILIFGGLVALIYFKDQPKFIPEKTREEVRGGIIEEIAKPIEKVAPSVGQAIIKAAANSQIASTNSADSTSNWQTYRDEANGFEVKYPAEWAVLKSNPRGVSFANKEAIDGLNSDATKYNDTDFPYWGGKVIEISELEKKNTLESYINSLFGTEGVEIVKMQINNFESYKVIDKSPDRFGGGIGFYYYIDLNNQWLELGLDYFLNQSSNDQTVTIFNKMAESISL